ncbi:hypothetical protein P7C70_g8380, partial [Phenoliferia sp. Uapishka_3]
MLPLPLLTFLLTSATAVYSQDAKLKRAPLPTHLAPTGRPTLDRFVQRHYVHENKPRQLSIGTGGISLVTTPTDQTTAAATTVAQTSNTDPTTAATTAPTTAAQTSAATTSPTTADTVASSQPTASQSVAGTTSPASNTSPSATDSGTSSAATSIGTSSGSASTSAADSAQSSGTSTGKSSKTTSTPSQTIITSTHTSIFTDSNGQSQTSVGVSESTSAAKSNKSTSSTGRTWGIVGGVVGGVVVLVGVIFIVYRLTQRRFGSLDDDGDEIRWPELQPDGQTMAAGASTLNPLGTRRREGAGVEMSERDEWGGDGSGGGNGGDVYNNSPYGNSQDALYEPVQYSDSPAGRPVGDPAYCKLFVLFFNWISSREL